MFTNSGISSLTFTKAGEALYLHSSSELQRISLSAAKVTKAHCALNLPPNARSTPEVATPEEKDTSTTEPEEKNEEVTNEEVVAKEKEVNQTQTSPKVITENGVVGSSEFSKIYKVSFLVYVQTHCVLLFHCACL